MKTKKRYSEQPEKEIWEYLLKYTYPKNIKNYLLQMNKIDVSEDLVNGISGSLSQAFEYFKLSVNASLQVSPLLLYYGATNLIFGSISLINGELIKIKNHGMKLSKFSSDERIGKIKFKLVDKESGGLSAYLKGVGLDPNIFFTRDEWTFEELSSSLIELVDDFIEIYGQEKSHVIPIKEVVLENETQFRVDLDFYNYENVTRLLNSIPEFSKNYFPTETNRKNELIIRKKINGATIHETSTIGQKFFLVGYIKEKQTIDFPYFIIFLMVLYILGMLCRYHPEFWNPFVERDPTGERNFVEKFIRIVRRQLPNLMLDIITEERNIYSLNQYNELDMRKNLNEDEIREIISEEFNARRLY